MLARQGRFVLMTGATGFLGSEFLRRKLQSDLATRFCLLVRDKARAEGALAEFMAIPNDRVELLQAKLADAELGLAAKDYARLVAQTTEVFHFAADLRFHLALDEARYANVVPTRHLLDFARLGRTAGCLEHFHQISTYAVARPERDGIAYETPARFDTVFRNTYEQTKAEAEWLVLERSHEIPATIYRTSIVGGDSVNGWTLRFNSLYQVMRLFLMEVAQNIPALPVVAGSRLDCVPIDFVADAIVALAQRSGGGRNEIFHLTAGSGAPSVANLLQRGFEILAQGYPRYALGTVTPPEVVEIPDREVEENALLDVLKSHASGKKSLMRLFEKYSPYFSDATLYDNTRLLKALRGTGVAPQSLSDCLVPVLEYCLKTSWGDRPEARPQLRRFR